MAAINQPGRARSRIALGVVGVLLVGGVAAALGLRSPPQMGADEEVFDTVDALFTAVTGRNEPRVGRCEQRLHALRDAGRLPPSAADYLDGVIRQARSGRWESAAERLYEFMQAQRREGAPEPRPMPPPPKGKSGDRTGRK